jgi:hypothetical protein
VYFALIKVGGKQIKGSLKTPFRDRSVRVEFADSFELNRFGLDSHGIGGQFIGAAAVSHYPLVFKPIRYRRDIAGNRCPCLTRR